MKRRTLESGDVDFESLDDATNVNNIGQIEVKSKGKFSTVMLDENQET